MFDTERVHTDSPQRIFAANDIGISHCADMCSTLDNEYGGIRIISSSAAWHHHIGRLMNDWKRTRLM